jgi:hypothetical protein
VCANKRLPRRPPRAWDCKDIDKMCARLAAKPPCYYAVKGANNAMKAVMVAHSTGATAREKRCNREPLFIRHLRLLLRRAVNEAARRNFQNRLICARQRWQQQLHKEGIARTVQAGGMVKKKCNLWPLTSVKTSAGIVSTPEQCLDEATQVFTEQWEGSINERQALVQ